MVWGRRFKEEATAYLLLLDCEACVSYIQRHNSVCKRMPKLGEPGKPSPEIQCRIEWVVQVPNPQERYPRNPSKAYFRVQLTAVAFAHHVKEREFSVSAPPFI